jgi:hypothetical protein
MCNRNLFLTLIATVAVVLPQVLAETTYVATNADSFSVSRRRPVGPRRHSH